jgi:hypothetical protein
MSPLQPPSSRAATTTGCFHVYAYILPHHARIQVSAAANWQQLLRQAQADPHSVHIGSSGWPG